MAIDPEISALVQAEQHVAISSDTALRAARPNARSSAAACLLEDAAAANAEASAQRQFLATGPQNATVRAAGDLRHLLFRSVVLPAGTRLIGGRRAWVRGISFDPIDDRTELQLIVEGV